MKRIFYYSGYRLTVFHWQNDTCIASYAFNPGEEGIEKFKTYLMASTNTPVRILVDLIEEDFKKESIPHVGSADRKAVVKRLIDRQYRKSSDYFHSKVIGRETSGRKDDILLYSVLSNPDILEPWLKPMQETGTSISGIWSLPLLTEYLYKKIQHQSNNILLVSQNVPSNLRQTFIKNGRFESSRSAVVNLDEASIGEHISSEVEQTIRFLSNQRHIGFDEKIEIHLIHRDVDLEIIKSHCSDSPLRTFHYHRIEDIQNSFSCKCKSLQYCNDLYSYICATQLIPIGHYGNKNTFSKYYEQLLSTSLYAANAIIFVISSIFSFSHLSDSHLFDKETVTLNQQTKGINNEYNKQLAKMEPQLNKTQLMKSTVLLAEKIQSNNEISPQKFMSDISKILSRSGMYDTEITKVNWTKHQKQIATTQRRQNNAPTLSLDYGSSDEISHKATIAGFIRVSQSSLAESVMKAKSITDAFKNNKAISSVSINHMPVDIRSNSSIENESTSNTNSDINNDRKNGKFEIEIIMQASDS